jgi:hypothetical protein
VSLLPLDDEEPFDPHLELGEDEWVLVQDAVRAVIAEGDEPADLDALAELAPVAAAFDELGIEAVPDRVETLRWALLDVDEAFRAADGRIFDRRRLVDGLTLTRRVTAGELADGCFELTEDLGPLLEIGADVFAMAGGDAEVEFPDRDAIEGEPGPVTWWLRTPPGALDGIEAGDLVALRHAGGELIVDVVRGTVEVGTLPDVLRETRGRMLEQDDRLETHERGIVELGDLVLATLAHDDDAFRRPAPPLSELLPLAALSTHGDLVADTDLDWGGWRAERAVLAELHRLEVEHDLDRDEAAQVLETLQLLEELDDAVADAGPDQHPPPFDPSDPRGTVAIAALARPRLLNAFLGEAIRRRQELRSHLDPFARSLLPHAPRRQRAGLHLVLAEHAMLQLRIEEAERHLRAALDDDADHPLALFDLARIACDRGDARRALDHLRRLGLPASDGFVEMMARYATAGPMSAGRNDPCPCGSGRKYKVCCAKRDGWPLAERVPWLLQKLRWMVATGEAYDSSLTLAELLVADPDDPDEVLETATSNPFVHDLALFEDGWLEAFLEKRGPLLPADELQLARSWVGIRRSLFEVDEVLPRGGLRVTDLRGGDTFEVRELLGRHRVKAGATVLARVLPDGRGHQFSLGVVPVELRRRASLLDLLDDDPGAEELAGFFTPHPPELRNTDGDPFTFCEVVYELDDPAAARRLLREAFDEVDEDTFVSTSERQGTTWRLAELRIEGDELTVSTNSEPRMETVMGRLEDLELPGTVVADGVTDPGELMTRASAGAADRLDPAELPPDLQAAVEGHLAAMEEAWIDERIPALGGVTPREALADPTRRADLLTLLDEFEATETPGPGPAKGFRTARLRELLGLTER